MCERFKEFVQAGFVQKRGKKECPFEKGCVPEEDCVMGDFLIAADKDSKARAIEPGDFSQSRFLAKLEAERSAKSFKAQSAEDIQFENKLHTLTSISRVN